VIGFLAEGLEQLFYIPAALAFYEAVALGEIVGTVAMSATQGRAA
jgi:hypothetical protein